MTAKLEVLIEAGKVEMRILSNSESEEMEARKIQEMIKEELSKIHKKVGK